MALEAGEKGMDLVKRWQLPTAFSSMSRHTFKVWENKEREVAGCDGFYLSWAVQSLPTPRWPPNK